MRVLLDFSFLTVFSLFPPCFLAVFLNLWHRPTRPPPVEGLIRLTCLLWKSALCEIFCHPIPLGWFRVGTSLIWTNSWTTLLVAELYAYLLEKKLVTTIFSKPRDGPPSLSFDTFKKCVHLRYRIQDLIDNKLIQFTTRSGWMSSPIPCLLIWKGTWMLSL